MKNNKNKIIYLLQISFRNLIIVIVLIMQLLENFDIIFQAVQQITAGFTARIYAQNLKVFYPRVLFLSQKKIISLRQ